jgi:hypothetical protein
MVERSDEARHQPGPELWWDESWYFDFAAVDGSLGGYVRLGYYPNQKVAWWWAYLCGPDRSLVAVRAHEVRLPRTGTEIRDEGLWACVTTETALEHWSVGLEAFAVALDDPLDAYRGERGDRVAFGLDLEWEAADVPSAAAVLGAPASAVSVGAADSGGPMAGAGGYGQSCDVYGEILVGEERIDFSGPGHRCHRWGELDWWAGPWCWSWARLDDGARLGWAGSEAASAMETVLDGEGLPISAAAQLNGPTGLLEVHITPVALAPILLTAGDARVGRLPRALCRVETDDGRRGVGWAEWNQPQRQP